jgi:transcriptional regulator with XRE-family HTH domain
VIKGDNVENVKRLIGDRIRRLRKEKGLSQEKLGYKAELHYTHIGSIERGEKNWSIDTLIKLAKGLNVEIVDLFNFPMPLADAEKMKHSLIKNINLSSPETIKMLLDLLNGLKSLKRPSP